MLDQRSPLECDRWGKRTEAHEFAPIPVTELIVHGVAPKTGSLILGAPATLESVPRPFRSLHISSPRSGFVIERKVCTAVLAVGGEMEFRNDPSDNLIVQTLGVVKGEFT